MIGGMPGGSEYCDHHMVRRRRIDAGSVGGAVWGRQEGHTEAGGRSGQYLFGENETSHYLRML